MAVTLVRGQELTRDDLNIYVYHQDTTQYFDPFRITYTVYRVTSDKFHNQLCGEEAILETVDSVPLPFGVGKFFAPWVMPRDIELGSYRIKWNIKNYYDTPYWQEEQEFEIIVPSSLCSDVNGDSGGTGPFPHDEYQGGCAEGI